MNEKFRSYTHGEGRTGEGQLVEFSCRPDEVEKVRQALLDIRYVELPQTHKVNVSHGGYGKYSRFDIKQHKYAGGGPGDSGGWGYIEVLEISNPPDGRCGIVIHQTGSGSRTSFTEWGSVAEAVAFWEKNWGGHQHNAVAKTAPGFKREVKCGLLTPWFYAIGEQGLIGDYAFPEGLQEDPVFRFGVRCLVPNENVDVLRTAVQPDGYSLKTCMGCRVFEEELERDNWSDKVRPKRIVRIVNWSDGTCWDSRRSFPEGYQPRPLQDDELWVDQALGEFHKLLTGKQTQFVINFAGGVKFIGRFVPEKDKREDPAGKYFGEVVFNEGELVKGVFDFTPTQDCPTAESKIRKKLNTEGKTIKSIKITRQETEKGGKKWSGVFFVK